MPNEDEGRLVERGAFRVDRARALEKLTRYQLPDPHQFVRPWLRLAVIREADSIKVSSALGTTVLSFGGAALPGDLLADPFGRLLEADAAPADESATMLAVGLLACLRLAPNAVTLRSGGRRWTRAADGSETSENDPAGPPGTELRVRWDGPAESVRFAREARAAAGMLPVPLDVDGDFIGAYSAAQGALVEKSLDRSRAFVCRPDPHNIGGAVQLYRNGVLLQTCARPGLGLLDAHLNDDGLALDISASAAVQDARFADALDYAEREAERAFPAEGRVGVAARAAQALGTLLCAGFMALLGTAMALLVKDHSRGRALDAIFGTTMALGCFAGALALLASLFRRALGR